MPPRRYQPELSRAELQSQRNQRSLEGRSGSLHGSRRYRHLMSSSVTLLAASILGIDSQYTGAGIETDRVDRAYT